MTIDLSRQYQSQLVSQLELSHSLDQLFQDKQENYAFSAFGLQSAMLLLFAKNYQNSQTVSDALNLTGWKQEKIDSFIAMQ